MPEHTPSPQPARAIYGFALFLISILIGIIYFIWALIPDCYLNAIGLYYLPDKYWAIAIPLSIVLFSFVGISLVIACNCIRLHGIFESIAIVDDDFGQRTELKQCQISLLIINMIVYYCSECKEMMIRQFRLFHQSCIVAAITQRRGPLPSGSQILARIRRRSEDIDHRNVYANDNEQMIEFESIAAERYYKANKNEFPKIKEYRDTFMKTKRMRKKKQQSTNDNELVQFPLQSTVDIGFVKTQQDDKLNEIEQRRHSSTNIDRGFFVSGNEYRDEYFSAKLSDIPKEELDIMRLNVKTQRVHLPRGHRVGPSDAIEEVERELGVGRSKKHQIDDDIDDEWMSNYSIADASIPAVDQQCIGCGARFHCQDTSLPGFIPVAMFVNEQQSKQQPFYNLLCRRCHLLKRHNFLLNVNVTPVDYCSLMGRLRLKQEALIILIVDMTDIPTSIYTQLPDVIGEHKSVIVVGNKVDLLPPDAHIGYLKHYRSVLCQTIRKIGFDKRFNILHTTLLSAKTGFGVEELITTIHMKWSNSKCQIRDDIYLVGCTNVGKSTLFNTFLQSDLCKVQAIDLIERATTSIWPGTTLNMLKFPVMNPTPHKLELRRKRLMDEVSSRKNEQKFAQTLIDTQRDGGVSSPFYVLQGVVDNSYRDLIEEQRFHRIDEFSNDVHRRSNADTRKERAPVWNPDDPQFASGRWCYDTPGTVNDNQIINKLTLDELVATVPKETIIPQTFVLTANYSILIAGIARIDIIHTNIQHRSFLLTLFISRHLPINIIETNRVDKFVNEFNGSNALVVPCGGNERLASFPKLCSQSIDIDGYTTWRKGAGIVDVTLSSIGWCMITADRDLLINMSVYTPNGVGIVVRHPPLIPYAASLRGSRIAGTRRYRIRPLAFPDHK